VYGDVVSKRQLGEQKEIAALCSRIGAGSGVLERLGSKGVTASLHEELRNEFQVQAQQKDATIADLNLSRGFLALRALNERLHLFISVT